MKNMQNTNKINFWVIEALLKQGKNIDIISTLIATLTILQCILLVCFHVKFDLFFIISLLSLLLWLIQKYFAIRVAIDAMLFGYLTKNNQPLAEVLQEIDHSLISLKLKLSCQRDPMTRQTGALVLLKKQVMSFIGQIMLWFTGLIGLFTML